MQVSRGTVRNKIVRKDDKHFRRQFFGNFSFFFFFFFVSMLSRIRLLDAILHQPTFHIPRIGKLIYNSKFPFTTNSTVLICMNVDIIPLIPRYKSNITDMNMISL